MKRALDGILPPEILERRKRGFGAPIGAWLKRDLQPMLLRLLSKQAVERRGLFSWPAIEETMALHFASREDHTDHLLALLNLEIWAQIYLDGRAPADLAAELTEAELGRAHLRTPLTHAPLVPRLPPHQT